MEAWFGFDTDVCSGAVDVTSKLVSLFSARQVTMATGENIRKTESRWDFHQRLHFTGLSVEKSCPKHKSK